MNQFLTKKKTIFTQIAYTASYGTELSIYMSLVIETLSSLQTMWPILKISFPASQDHSALVFHKIRDFISSVSFFSSLVNFESETHVISLWIAYSTYVLLNLIFTIAVVFSHKKGIKICQRVEKTYTIVNIIHSKLFFGIVLYFYLKFLVYKQNCNSNQTVEIICGKFLPTCTIIFILINLAMASLKEFFFYKKCKGKNAFAINCNFHAIIQLAHKTVLLLMAILMDKYLIANAMLNLFFSLLYHLVLLIRLPLHDIKCLQVASFLSSISFAFSLMFFGWALSDSIRTRVFELLIIIMTPMFIKLMQRVLDYILARISELKPILPNHIIHLRTLLKRDLSDIQRVHTNKMTESKTLYANGLVQAFQQGEIGFWKTNNLFVLEELLKYHKRNPQSTHILLALIQFYIDKIKNISSAMVYMQKAERLPLSTPERNALVYLKEKLKKQVVKVYSDSEGSMDYVNYFMFEAIFTSVKQKIQKEANLHAEFWRLLSNNKIEIYQALEISKQADQLSCEIDKFMQKILQEQENQLKACFPILIIIHGIYLLSIRGLSQRSKIFLETLYGKLPNCIDALQKWLKQERASIIISNQKNTVGKVLAASSSVSNLFRISKENLIGKKVNMFMPRMIDREHDNLILRHSQKPGYSLNLNTSGYCKTADGLFFPAQVNGKIYPDFGKGLGLIGNIIKKGDHGSILFLDFDGTIIDCSKELTDIFSINTYLKEVKMQDIAIEFEEVNKAFNVVYGLKKSLTRPQLLSILTEHQKTELVTTPQFLFPKYPKAGQYLISEASKSLLTSEVFTLTRKEGSLNSKTFLSYKNLTASDLPPVNVFQKEKNMLNIIITNHDYDDVNNKDEHTFDLDQSIKICKEFEEGKVISFVSKMNATETLLRYLVNVQHYLFENQLYKIVKLKKIDHEGKNTQEIIQYAKNRSQFAQKTQLQFTKIIPKEAKSEDGDSLEPAEEFISAEQKRQEERRNLDVFSESSKNVNVHVIEEQARMQRESCTSSQSHSNRLIERIFSDIFSKEKITSFTRGYFIIFYFAIIFVVALATLGLIVTRVSFNQIKVAAELVNYDSERLYNLMNIWSRVNIFYTLTVQKESPDEKLRISQLIPSQVQQINFLSNQVVSLLEVVNSNDIFKEYYRRDIRFWGDYNGHFDDSIPFDMFAAINIIINPLTTIINESYILSNPYSNTIIFALNNTVNELLLSAERKLKVTQRVKTNLCIDNITLIQNLILGQSLSICLIFLSLVVLIIRIHKSHLNLFRILSTFSLVKIKTREDELVRFNNWLQAGHGTSKFVKQLNEYLEDSTQVKSNLDISASGIKRQDKVYVTCLKSRDRCLLVATCFIFMFIMSLFLFNAILSLKTVPTLQRNIEFSQIAERMAYQVDLLRGNFFYFLNFNSQTATLVRNELKEDQLTKNFVALSDINNQLNSVSIQQGNEFSDPIVEKLLSSSVCDFISTALDFCVGSESKKVFGLLGLNMQHERLFSQYMEAIQNSTSKETYKKIIQSYLQEMKPLNQLLREGYIFLRRYLLEDLTSNIEDHSQDLVTLFIIICLACGFGTISLRVSILKRLLTFEREKYKILKLIPQKFLLENKAVFYYLKREFGKELVGLSSNLLN